MIHLLLFLICLFASTVGAIGGAGGGVIITPVVDALDLLLASSVSLLSSCTVLCMTASSYLRGLKDNVKVRYSTTTPLAVGAALGGFLGNLLFSLVCRAGDEAVLKLVQAIGLAFITALVLLYICVKDRIRSYQVESMLVCLLSGILLGVISSFFGIGGGTSNVALLFLLFSMEAKEAARNSSYIILLSQSVNISSFLLRGNVPAFEWLTLMLMAAGGMGGALLGAAISRRMNSKSVTLALKALCAAMVLVNLVNAIRVAMSL